MLFEPMDRLLRSVVARKGDIAELTPSAIAGKACLDPRAAVALLESLPPSRYPSVLSDTTRTELAEALVSRLRNGGSRFKHIPASFRLTIDGANVCGGQPPLIASLNASTFCNTSAKSAAPQRVINVRGFELIEISESRLHGRLKATDRSIGIRSRQALLLGFGQAVIVPAEHNAPAQEAGRLVRRFKSDVADRQIQHDGPRRCPMVLSVELERAEGPVRIAGRPSMNFVQHILAVDALEQRSRFARKGQRFCGSPALAQQLREVMQARGRGRTGTP